MKGRLLGHVADQASGQPVAGAVVRIAASSLTPLATDEGGNFISYELDPGDFELEISQPEYEPRRCAGTIPPAGGDVAINCTLAELPITGSVKGSVHDQYGASVAGARILLTGPTAQSLTTGPNGEFSASELMPGDYSALIESDPYFTRTAHFSVQTRQQTAVEIALVLRPAKPSIQLKGKEIRSKALTFPPDSVELGPGAAQAVAEIADLLLRTPTMRVRIQGDGGDALALTRALALKQRLVEAGVPDGRIDAASEPAKSVTITVEE